MTPDRLWWRITLALFIALLFSAWLPAVTWPLWNYQTEGFGDE